MGTRLMNRDRLLVILTTAGSAICWWPVIVHPSLDLPWWLPLVIIGLYNGLAACLSNRSWLSVLGCVVGSAVGTFAGIFTGFLIWSFEDPLVPLGYVMVLGSLAVILVSILAGLAGFKLSVSNENRRRAVWLVLLCCVASGPVALALTPPLVAVRVARNERIASQRFASLKNAVKRTMAESSGAGRLCDGSALQRRYSGPPLSAEDWRFITGNYVKRDGYVFMIYCREQGGYTIVAGPAREKADGNRGFCTDESGKMGCGMQWNRSRNACTPCTT